MRLFTRLVGWVRLCHPFPVAMTVLATLVFAWLARPGQPPHLDELGRIGLAMLLSQISISAYNDYCDRSLDAATKPWKPIPAGQVPARAAFWLGILTYLLMWPVASTFGVVPAVVLGFATAMGLLYDLWLKRTSLSIVPFLVAFPLVPIWASVALGSFQPRMALFFPAGALLVLGIHLADTLPDLEDDAGAGLQGLAHRLGRHRAMALSWVAFVATLALAMIVAWQRGALSALALACVGGALALGGLALGSWQPTPQRLRRAFYLQATGAVALAVALYIVLR
ncbi:MAG: ubiquinone biosynthesis protein UbiA [Chloroflexota bacterium]